MNNELKLREHFPPGSEIIVEYVNEAGIILKGVTAIEDLEGEYLVLNTPLENGNPVDILEGQELTLRHFEDPVNKAYVTSVFVIERRSNNRLLLVCCNPREIKDTSLRRFTRYYVEMPVTYALNGKTISGRTVNLSLSGCNIIADNARGYNLGDKIELALNLNSDSDVIILAEVIRVYDIPVIGETGVAFSFCGMNEEMRETLKDYLFQCQLLEKGILGSKPHSG